MLCVCLRSEGVLTKIETTGVSVIKSLARVVCADPPVASFVAHESRPCAYELVRGLMLGGAGADGRQV